MTRFLSLITRVGRNEARLAGDDADPDKGSIEKMREQMKEMKAKLQEHEAKLTLLQNKNQQQDNILQDHEARITALEP